MILKLYIVILAYFLIGFIAFYFINRKRDAIAARKSWTKTIAYFFIINIVFFSIVVNPVVFHMLAAVIIVAGLFELHKLFRESGYRNKNFFFLSLMIFAAFSFGFFIFSGMEKEMILFTFMILSIFDSFSEITGRFMGRRKLFPKISPEKTVEGLTGGILVAFISAFLLRNLIGEPLIRVLLLAGGIMAFAFTGDLTASVYKRNYKVKDFSNLIPENGGFLDRFDSLIAGGAWAALFGLLAHLV